MEEREEGILSYPNSPGMTQENRFIKIKTPEKKAKDGRVVDESGRALIPYASMQPEASGDTMHCKLRYRDGREVEIGYPSIREALKAGAYVDLQGSVLDGEDLSGLKGLDTRSFKNSSCIGTKFIGIEGKGISFENALLDGADFTSAKLLGVNLRTARMNSETVLKKTIFDYGIFTGLTGFENVKEATVSVKHSIGLNLENLTVEEEVKESVAEILKEKIEGEESKPISRTDSYKIEQVNIALIDRGDSIDDLSNKEKIAMWDEMDLELGEDFEEE